MYWRVSKLSCENEKLPDGKFAPELYINGNGDDCVFIKYDEEDRQYPWCVFQERRTYGQDFLNRFNNFNEAYQFMLEVNRGE